MPWKGVSNDHGDDAEDKDATMLVPKSSIDNMLTEGNLNFYDVVLGCAISLTVTMIGMCAEILKPEDMHGKLPDGWSQKFDCENSAVNKLRLNRRLEIFLSRALNFVHFY